MIIAVIVVKNISLISEEYQVFCGELKDILCLEEFFIKRDCDNLQICAVCENIKSIGTVCGILQDKLHVSRESIEIKQGQKAVYCTMEAMCSIQSVFDESELTVEGFEKRISINDYCSNMGTVLTKLFTLSLAAAKKVKTVIGKTKIAGRERVRAESRLVDRINMSQKFTVEDLKQFKLQVADESFAEKIIADEIIGKFMVEFQNWEMAYANVGAMRKATELACDIIEQRSWEKLNKKR